MPRTDPARAPGRRGSACRPRHHLDRLRDRLVPSAGQLAIVGAGADCDCAVDSLLAGLAWRLGRPDEAAERARTGLALETRVGSQRWITRTRNLLDRIAAQTQDPK